MYHWWHIKLVRPSHEGNKLICKRIHRNDHLFWPINSAPRYYPKMQENVHVTGIVTEELPKIVKNWKPWKCPTVGELREECLSPGWGVRQQEKCHAQAQPQLAHHFLPEGSHPCPVAKSQRPGAPRWTRGDLKVLLKGGAGLHGLPCEKVN